MRGVNETQTTTFDEVVPLINRVPTAILYALSSSLGGASLARAVEREILPQPLPPLASTQPRVHVRYRQLLVFAHGPRRLHHDAPVRVERLAAVGRAAVIGPRRGWKHPDTDRPVPPTRALSLRCGHLEPVEL